MQEFWVKPGERVNIPAGVLKPVKIDEKKGIKFRLIPQSDLDEVSRVRGSLVEPIRPKLKALVQGVEQ